MKRATKLVEAVLLIIGLIVLLYLLFWRVRLGMVRYFDVDEFAHLHWAYNLFKGYRPYTDFFYIIPPFFLYLLTPIWMLFKDPFAALIQARILMFVIFIFTSFTLFDLMRLRRNILISLTSVIIFSILPMPYDKMIEIRPDLVATFFSLSGLYLLVKGIRKKLDEHTTVSTRNYFFLSGLFYAVSIGFVPKTIFSLPPLVVLFIVLLVFSQKEKGKIVRMGVDWILGFIGIIGLIGVLLAWYGNLPWAVYLIFKVSSDATKLLASQFFIQPTTFFYPNQTYYGIWGYSFPYVANIIIWWVGIGWAILRLVGSGTHEKISDRAGIFLLASTLILNIWGFIHFFPLKHAQYLISFAPFIVYFFSDFLGVIYQQLKRVWVVLPYILTILIFGIAVYIAHEMNSPKQYWTNDGTRNDLSTITKTAPRDSFLLDLTGYSLVYKDPFYICCVPYGQYIFALPKLPSLSESLEKTNTQYALYYRLDTLVETDRNYILKAYPKVLLPGLLLGK